MRSRLPNELGSLISDAIFGFTKKLTRELYSGLDQHQKAMVEEEKHAINLDREVAARKAKEDAERAKVLKEKEAAANKEREAKQKEKAAREKAASQAKK